MQKSRVCLRNRGPWVVRPVPRRPLGPRKWLLDAVAVGFRGAVRAVEDDAGMGQNFVVRDRGQTFLLPPPLMDWLPEDHLVWTLLGAVEERNLDVFYGAYRANGQGRAAYDPAMMVALLLYGYAMGNRSSRGIERSVWRT